MSRFIISLVLVIASCVGSTVKAGDVIDLDLTLVDPSARDLFVQAEKFWEDRIAGYSSELPGRLRNQIGALAISATVASIDGEGGILGFAGPDVIAVLRQSQVTVPVGDLGPYPDRSYAVALRSSMTFDLDDFPSLEADGILFDVIVHEMGHALGVGSLWLDNGLFRELNLDGDVYTPEEFQYQGKYAVEQFRMESGQALAPFVPVENRGGAGTAGGHWFDGGFFNTIGQNNAKKAIMTGFLCDPNPNDPTSLICLPKFLSRSTLGSLADLGFAVNGVNQQFAVPRNMSPRDSFPKGATYEPVSLAGGVSLQFGGPTINVRASMGSVGKTDKVNGDSIRKEDPYRLRGRSWATPR
jgi:hypothetical protein